ncbi:unnamed protein product [Rotaria sordida]|uniref:Metalloendopeptidase n=1 Tax=Rotaria sordida TaxID=392033 RepID=A0A818GDM8_9BILA|nr:unnamed protein product [Rotaria sordida]CAF3487711.1 unnamed protein product [Rotaria sordida]
MAFLLGGGFEGDMILPDGFDPTRTPNTKGVAIYGPRRWPNNIIPYDISSITSFYHEQSRPDRDSYVTINQGNIESGHGHNFNKYTWGTTVLNQNSPYDYGSIMHYGANGFSSNGKPTITPKQPNTKIGQREKLSATDINEIRAYYGCSS